jgi:hypothetical protein
MSDQKLTIDLRGVGNDIPTRLGKSRPTLTKDIYEAIQESGFRIPFGSYYYVLRSAAWKVVALPLSFMRKTSKRLLGTDVR